MPGYVHVLAKYYIVNLQMIHLEVVDAICGVIYDVSVSLIGNEPIPVMYELQSVGCFSNYLCMPEGNGNINSTSKINLKPSRQSDVYLQTRPSLVQIIVGYLFSAQNV